MVDKYKQKSSNYNYLITGSAGFIGFHLTNRLILNGENVISLDNINSYYDVKLKQDRLTELEISANQSNGSFKFIKGDLEDIDLLKYIFQINQPHIVIHLAAQAGVRHSIDNPNSYIESNICGFNNILECCRRFPVKHLIYASSSSVYGGNIKVPFSEKDSVDHPVSLYAATKKSNELMAHTYSHLYDIPATGLRFFTVYGPWGRPDMAPMIFTKNILANKAIKIFNYGQMSRDFTYIDDVIRSILLLVDKPPSENKNYNYNSSDPSRSWCSHQIFNIGNSKTIKLMDFIEILENEIGIKAKKDFKPMQAGDVKSTAADTSAIENFIKFKPNTSVKEGIRLFIRWYKDFYKI